MLRRNGEVCEHPVPNYPGLLTDSEQRAYNEAIFSLDWLLKEFDKGANALAEIERQIPRLAELTTNTADKSLTIYGANGEWQVHQTLRKGAHCELLLCSRQSEHGLHFGIVERQNSNSLYAQKHGNADLLMTSNRPSLLLQDFVESERHVLQLFQQDIEATVEQTLAERFPAQDCSRAVRAISARCGTQSSSKTVNGPAEKQTRTVKIRI